MTLNLFEITAAILAATAAAAWLNAQALKLPVAVGLLVLGLAVSGLATLSGAFAPGLGLDEALGGFVGRIDYARLVLQFLLAYLLYAGAMNVDLEALGRRGWAVAVLALVGTAVTAALIAVGFWGLARLGGIALPFHWALVFGVLISPTDPIAVLAMTKRTALERELKAQLEGEALFNDGIAVVLFRLALAAAIAGGAAPGGDPLTLAGHALVEAFGGAALGAVGGLLAIFVIRRVDDWPTETLATVAVATGVYALALRLNLSGPIGVVVAGLITGSHWAEQWMSARTRRHIHPFWGVVDESMNAVLFFLLGLKAFELRAEPAFLIPALAAPLLVLIARWIAIALPSAALPLFRRKASVRLINVLTWAGVRGGLSAAMALTLPEGREKQLILAATLAVVVFSIAVQSMTMERLALATGYGVRRDNPEPLH